MPHALRFSLLVLLLAAWSGPVLAQQPVGVRVSALLSGKAPRMALLKKTTNDPACVAKNPWATEEDLLVSAAGGIRNVVVFVSRNAPQGEPRDAELTHTACMYRPRVAAVSAGATTRFINGDQTTHHVHVFKGNKTLLHEVQPAGGAPVAKDLSEHVGSFLRVRCDLHPWEQGYVYVVPTPAFGVTSENGETLLPDLPPGTYSITAWHERLGAKTVDVTVGPDGRADVKILYDGTEPRP